MYTYIPQHPQSPESQKSLSPIKQLSSEKKQLSPGMQTSKMLFSSKNQQSYQQKRKKQLSLSEMKSFPPGKKLLSLSGQKCSSGKKSQIERQLSLSGKKQVCPAPSKTSHEKSSAQDCSTISVDNCEVEPMKFWIKELDLNFMDKAQLCDSNSDWLSDKHILPQTRYLQPSFQLKKVFKVQWYYLNF